MHAQRKEAFNGWMDVHAIREMGAEQPKGRDDDGRGEKKTTIYYDDDGRGKTRSGRATLCGACPLQRCHGRAALAPLSPPLFLVAGVLIARPAAAASTTTISHTVTHRDERDRERRRLLV